jgi:hypothetical protein
VNTTNSLPRLEQLYPLINWQLHSIPGSVNRVTIIGITHHPYTLSSIKQQTLLTFSQDDHTYHCQLSQYLKIVSSQHSDLLYIFSFSLDKECISKQYLCPF